jgi:hypothetical protein
MSTDFLLFYSLISTFAGSLSNVQKMGHPSTTLPHGTKKGQRENSENGEKGAKGAEQLRQNN